VFLKQERLMNMHPSPQVIYAKDLEVVLQMYADWQAWWGTILLSTSCAAFGRCKRRRKVVAL